MKKAVAFLLAFLIFVTPVTTLVKADVVIGDNDDTIINENATILGRKFALLESFSDLALSGVTKFTISNTNDVDSYLDYLWGEINDSIESLSNGTGFQEISDTLKSQYFTNLVKYRDYINNRGDYLSYTFQNPSTSLLQTYFANNIYGKQYTEHYDLALDTFKALSRYTPSSNPIYPDDYAYLIELINGESNGYGFFWGNYQNEYLYNGNIWYAKYYPFTSVSYFKRNYSYEFVMLENTPYQQGSLLCSDSVLTLNINTISDNSFQGNISGITIVNPSCSASQDFSWGNGVRLNFLSNGTWYGNNGDYRDATSCTFNGTSILEVLSYFAQRFRNINIYVDGVPWAVVAPSINPSLDIDGFLKLFGNDRPQEYNLQPNTKIDYDQLYQVIYNAIRDNLPISKDDITYYDSHDNIYTPTIINNYGDENGDESDLIDTILDYAVIPSFDVAIAQPMRQALTNGVVFMNKSITNVIPNEILLVLGACFFLLLFAVVINRMIK